MKFFIQKSVGKRWYVFTIILILSLCFFSIILISMENKKTEFSEKAHKDKSLFSPQQQTPQNNSIEKGKVIKKLSQVFQNTEKEIEVSLSSLEGKISYVDKKEQYGNLEEFINEKQKILQETNKDYYTSITNIDFQRLLSSVKKGPSLYKFLSFFVAYSPRKCNNGIDWQKVNKKLNDCGSNEVIAIKPTLENYQKIESHLLRKKRLGVLAKQEFIYLKNIAEFNQWINDYLNEITIIHLLLAIESEMAEKLKINGNKEWKLEFEDQEIENENINKNEKIFLKPFLWA